MSTIDVNVMTDPEDPNKVNVAVTIGFAFKLDEAQKILKTLRQADIVSTISRLITEAMGRATKEENLN